MCGKGEVEDADTAQSNNKEGEKNKYGPAKVYDPTFNGPIHDRGCTDIICCILFLVCILGMVVVGFFAYTNGDPSLLLYPSDSDGNLCGYGVYKDQPNLFFFDIIDCAKVGPAVVATGCPTKQICVATCPTEYWTWATQYGKEKIEEGINKFSTTATDLREKGRASMMCDYGVNPLDNIYASAKDLQALVEDGICAGYFYPQEEILGRCLPAFLSAGLDTATALAKKVGDDNVTSDIRDSKNQTVTIDSILDGSAFVTKLLEARSYGEKVLSDVENAKWFIVFGIGLGMVIAFLWIVVMRWLAGIIVWVTIVIFVGLFVFCSYYSYTTYYNLKKTQNTTSEWILTTDFNYYLTLKEVWLGFGCTSATILIILVLIILFLRTRILIAIALIKEGSRAIGMMMFTLLWPIWPFIFQMALVVYFGATCLYLASSTKKVYSSTDESVLNSSQIYDYGATSTAKPTLIEQIPCEPDNTTAVGKACNFVKNDVLEYTMYLQIYMLFMFFWVMNWIVGFGQMVLAGAFASYYWAFDKKEHMPMFPILQSVKRTLIFHTGSIAFGALIIAIIQMIRVGLEYLDSKLKGAENRIAKFFLKCLKCCFYLLEKFMKMINKNAYILIAIYGKNFCTAAKDAFFLIMRNIVRVAVVDKVTDFLLFVSKLVVVGAITVLSFFFFNGTLGTHLTILQQYEPKLNYFFVPVILIGISTYIVASIFFSVYGMAVDTLFLCFLEDLERNDGSAEKPYYMNKELKDVLGKKNARPDKED